MPVGVRCGRESHTPPKGLSGALIELGSRGERERHNVADHNFGVKIFQLCSVSSSLSHENLEQPFRTLAIKWEIYIFIKKSSCVFIIASVYLLCRYDTAHENTTYYAITVINHIYHTSSSSRSTGTDFPDFLSPHPSLSSIAPGRFSKLHPVSVQSWCR